MADRALQVESVIAGFCDDNGLPYASGKVYFYEEGTSTKVTLYTQADKGATTPNPITLNDRGAVSTPIFLDDNVKIVLEDSDGNEIDTWDELTYTFANFSVEHNADGTHKTGNFDNTHIAAAAGIVISKLANVSDEHNAGGTHKDITFGDGGMICHLFTLSNNVYIGMNCSWTGTEFTADNNTKSASIIWLAGGGTMKISNRVTTTSNWTTWDITNTFIDGTGNNEAIWGVVSTYMEHSTTTKSIVIPAAAFVGSSNNNPATVGVSVVEPAAADDAYDYAQAPVILPVGAKMTGYTIYGNTEAHADNVCNVTLRKAFNNTASTTIVDSQTITIENSETSAAASAFSETILDTTRYMFQVEIKVEDVGTGGLVSDARLYQIKLTYTVANLGETL
jgi:hypothetical protein